MFKFQALINGFNELIYNIDPNTITLIRKSLTAVTCLA